MAIFSRCTKRDMVNQKQIIKKLKDKEPSIETIISSGYLLIIDLISQIDKLYDCDKKLLDNRGILTSSVILSFSILEIYTNFISELLITEHKREEASPKIITRLKDIELDILIEKKSIFDYKKLTIKKENNSYIPILDKIIVIPQLLAKAYNHKFILDKSGNNWSYIRSLKEKRDEISHPKFQSNAIQPIVDLNEKNDIADLLYSINPKNILDGLIGIRWYLKINGDLVASIYNGKFSSSNLFFIDTIIRDLILKINHIFKLDNKLDKKIDGVYTFQESRDKKLDEILKWMTKK